jgi:hypothetical protein
MGSGEGNRKEEVNRFSIKLTPEVTKMMSYQKELNDLEGIRLFRRRTIWVPTATPYPLPLSRQQVIYLSQSSVRGGKGPREGHMTKRRRGLL